MAGVQCTSLGPLKDVLPESPEQLLSHIEDRSVLDRDFDGMLEKAAQGLFSHDYKECLETCDILLDRTWEKLNTGNWKDVNVNWRYAYTLLSVMKSLSQCALLSNSSSNIDHTAIIKTCDLGLLMGAPVMDNILAKMARKFQECFGENRSSPSESGDEDVIRKNPRKKAREEEEEEEDSNKVAERKEEEAKEVESKEETSMNGGDSAVGVIIEREVPHCGCPSVEMFNAMFFDLQCPVVITGAIGYWPAFTTHKWSIEYLQKMAGARTVPVEIGSRYTDDNWTQKLMTVNEFIDSFITNPKSDVKGYLAQHNLFDQVIVITLSHFIMFNFFTYSIFFYNFL
jgi:lysine-specific demethylase 8